MKVRLLSFALALVASASISGCNDDGDEELFGESPPDEDPASITPATVQAFAGLSAPNIFGAALVPYLIAGLETADSTSTCPEVTANGNTTVYEGGCVGEDGKAIVGRATYTTDGATATLVYEGFGFEAPSDGCASSPSRLVYDGTLRTMEEGSSGGSFEIDVSFTTEAASASCQVFSSEGRIEYSGSVVGSMSMTDPGTLQYGKWNGSGTYWTSLQGKLHSETVDELIDQAICEYEAASGQTTLTAGDDVLVVTYDGASDCDEGHTVRVQLDGKDLGEVSNVACAFGVPSRMRTAAPLLFALALFVTLGRRRRSSC
jgi:hypothetical protein